jgi:hypothetical protein
VTALMAVFYRGEIRLPKPTTPIPQTQPVASPAAPPDSLIIETSRT